MDTKLEPKLATWVDATPYFHPWVHKVAQVVPNGAQSGSKGAQRLPKWSQNGTKMEPKWNTFNIFLHILDQQAAVLATKTVTLMSVAISDGMDNT